VLASGEEFREYLRAEAVRAVRTLLESVMRAEMDALIGCGWGESSPNRKGYRNGYYQRDLLTTSGKIENLKVPRDRAGEYESQVFEQYRRNEPAINATVTEMYVAGASVAKVGGAVEQLTGTPISASAVSRITGDLTEQFLAWQKRKLLPHYRIFYLDAVRYQVRHKDATDPLVVLAILAVDLEGKKELIALKAAGEETKAGWCAILNEVRGRGVEAVDVIVSDGHTGLIRACDEIFTATPRQRCLLHKNRDIMAAFPARVEATVKAELKAIWLQPNKALARECLAAFRGKYQKQFPNALASLEEEIEKTLTFYDFPVVLHKYLRTTNAIESMFSQVRDRTDKVDVFTTEMSCLTLVWATIDGIKFHRIGTT
jgi:transposase-like protein